MCRWNPPISISKMFGRTCNYRKSYVISSKQNNQLCRAIREKKSGSIIVVEPENIYWIIWNCKFYIFSAESTFLKENQRLRSKSWGICIFLITFIFVSSKFIASFWVEFNWNSFQSQFKGVMQSALAGRVSNEGRTDFRPYMN